MKWAMFGDVRFADVVYMYAVVDTNTWASFTSYTYYYQINNRHAFNAAAFTEVV